MHAAILMALATALFASMGVTVKLASAAYGTGEIAFYRGLIGALLITRVRHQMTQAIDLYRVRCQTHHYSRVNWAS